MVARGSEPVPCPTDTLATWSALARFEDCFETIPTTPGVYMAREGARGPVVYVGMAGERRGRAGSHGSHAGGRQPSTRSSVASVRRSSRRSIENSWRPQADSSVSRTTRVGAVPLARLRSADSHPAGVPTLRAWQTTCAGDLGLAMARRRRDYRRVT